MQANQGIRAGFAAVLLAVSAVLIGGAVASADSTIVVKSTDLNGWAIVQNNPGVPVANSFVAGPAAIGAGSLQFGPVPAAPGSSKLILVAPIGGLTADLLALSYDFYIAPASPGGASDAAHLYLNVYVDSSANGIGTYATFYDCRYDSAPLTGAVGGWTTHSVSQGGSWTNVANALGSCPATLAGLPAGSEILFATLNVGDTSTSDAGVQGAYDKVVVTGPSGATTYDFEPLIGPPANKDACKKGGWQTFNNPAFKNQGECVSYVQHQ